MATIYIANIATAGLVKGQTFTKRDAPPQLQGLLDRGFVAILTVDPKEVKDNATQRRRNDNDSGEAGRTPATKSNAFGIEANASRGKVDPAQPAS